jgi:hypothetical protein
MRHAILGITMMVGVLGFMSVAQARCTDPRADAVRDEILNTCQCTGNHGQYVSCVAHAVRDAVRNGELEANCKGSVTKCAARSTCGKKEGFVTCVICEAGTCENGFCDDGTTACADSSTCPPIVKRCSIKSSAEKCEARGGIVGPDSCCDAVCASTSTVPTTSAPPTTSVPTTTAAPTTSTPTTSTPPTTAPPTTTTTLVSPSGAFLD